MGVRFFLEHPVYLDAALPIHTTASKYTATNPFRELTYKKGGMFTEPTNHVTKLSRRLHYCKSVSGRQIQNCLK